MRHSISSTSAGRAKGPGVGSPRWRGRSIALKKSSRPFGTISHGQCNSSWPPLMNMWRRFLPTKMVTPGLSG